MFIYEAPLAAQCAAPVALTQPRACELPCMLVLRVLSLDWTTAGTKHRCVRGLKRTASCLSPKVRSRATETGRWEVRPASCKSVRRTHDVQASSRNDPPPPRHLGLRVLFCRSSNPLSLPRTKFQAKSLGERCPNFRSSSPHQIGVKQPMSSAFFSSYGVHFIFVSALVNQLAPRIASVKSMTQMRVQCA